MGCPCSPRDSQESAPTHSSKASILWHSAFFIVQLSHSYMTTGKTIALTRTEVETRVRDELDEDSRNVLLTFTYKDVI